MSLDISIYDGPWVSFSVNCLNISLPIFSLEFFFNCKLVSFYIVKNFVNFKHYIYLLPTVICLLPLSIESSIDEKVLLLMYSNFFAIWFILLTLRYSLLFHFINFVHFSSLLVFYSIWLSPLCIEFGILQLSVLILVSYFWYIEGIISSIIFFSVVCLT